MEYLRWPITAILIVSFGFFWWRKLRSEYPEKEIYNLLATILFVLVLGGVVGNLVIFRSWGWWGSSSLAAATVAFWIICHKAGGDIWEWMDTVVIIALVHGILACLAWGKWEMGAVLAGGMALTWIIKKTYRKWRWYKSGRPGIAGGFGLAVWGVTEIIIAFIKPDKLYWGELSANQWFGSWLLTAALVSLYIRTGKILWPKPKIKKTTP